MESGNQNREGKLQVEVIDNFSQHLIDILPRAIEQSRDVRIAVAFVSDRGVSLIQPSIELALSKGATVEFLVGLDGRVTQPKALERLHNLTLGHGECAFYCFSSVATSRVYHPKLYALKDETAVTCVVGSSNLTEGGLKRNVEINLLLNLESETSLEVISNIYTAYNRLKFHPDRVIPDAEYIALYSKLFEFNTGLEKESARPKVLRKLEDELKKKSSGLQRPAPTSKDLVGWLDIVYDSLPEGEFTNQQVYRFEPEFHRVFPHNTKIKAKIRQQLQVLRDIGFLKHVRRGVWRKL